MKYYAPLVVIPLLAFCIIVMILWPTILFVYLRYVEGLAHDSAWGWGIVVQMI